MKSSKKTTPRVVSTKSTEMAGSQPELSAKIGGVANKPTSGETYKKGK